MQISEEKIEKYMEIYFEEYGRSIDKAQALIELTALLCVLNAVYRHQNKSNE